MAIFVYVEQYDKFSLSQIWRGQKTNPGIGGTTFQQLRLYEELCEKTDHSVFLVIDSDAEELSKSSNILGLKSMMKLAQTRLSKSTLIINSGGLERNYSYLTYLVPKLKRTLCWLHHPFDRKKIAYAKRLGADLVSCGIFQYFSNSYIGGEHSQIYNYFYADAVEARSKEISLEFDSQLISSKSNVMHIGYWGALTPSKGFHLVAKHWKQICNICAEHNLTCLLHVIGSDFYDGVKYSYKEIPTSPEYSESILKSFGSDNLPSNVNFYGTLKNPYALARHFDICFVNPSGVGEAASQTVLELFALGVPVITSTLFGMSDYRVFLNTFGIKHHKEIPGKVLRFIEMDDVNSYKKFLRSTSKLFSAYKENSTIRWLLLTEDANLNKANFNPSIKCSDHWFIVTTDVRQRVLVIRAAMLVPLKGVFRKLRALIH